MYKHKQLREMETNENDMVKDTLINKSHILQSPRKSDYIATWQSDMTARLTQTYNIQTLAQATVITTRSGRASKNLIGCVVIVRMHINTSFNISSPSP